VIDLVGDVENELARLVTTFGVKNEQQTKDAPTAGKRVSPSDVDNLLREFWF
jgi:hypothetical protein